MIEATYKYYLLVVQFGETSASSKASLSRFKQATERLWDAIRNIQSLRSPTLAFMSEDAQTIGIFYEACSRAATILDLMCTPQHTRPKSRRDPELRIGSGLKQDDRVCIVELWPDAATQNLPEADAWLRLRRTSGPVSPGGGRNNSGTPRQQAKSAAENKEETV